MVSIAWDSSSLVSMGAAWFSFFLSTFDLPVAPPEAPVTPAFFFLSFWSSCTPPPLRFAFTTLVFDDDDRAPLPSILQLIICWD